MTVLSHDLAQLTPGIRILCSNHLRRLATFPGTRAGPLERYEASARIPRQPRQPIKTMQYEILTSSSLSNTTRSFVAVIPVPKAIRQTFNAPRTGLAPSERQSKRAAETVEVAHTFARSLSDGKDLECLGVIVREKGLSTSTYNPAQRRFIGLHLDSFYRAELEARDDSPNRLCINLTSEPRALLFINLTIAQCHRMLALSGCSDERMREPRTPGIPRLFMEVFPDYPVVEIMVGADEAYIAPTENMIHDSCTLHRTRPDAFLTFLGNFGEKRAQLLLEAV